MGLHALPIHWRALPLSRQLAAHSERAGASFAPGVRQRLAPRRVAAIQAAVPNSANHRVLCRDRRQRLAVQFRRKGRRSGPAALVDGRTLPYQDRALRSGIPAAGAGRARLLHRVRYRRARGSHRQDHEGRIEARPTFRRLRQRHGDQPKDLARRVQKRRRVVSHRRSDAQGQERLLLFRRPHWRYLPLERRERVDYRGGGGGRPVRRRSGDQRLRRANARP